MSEPEGAPGNQLQSLALSHCAFCVVYSRNHGVGLFHTLHGELCVPGAWQPSGAQGLAEPLLGRQLSGPVWSQNEDGTDCLPAFSGSTLGAGGPKCTL